MAELAIFPVVVIVVLLVVIYPMGRILKRIGYSPWWALVWLVPLGNLLGLWLLATQPWPRDENVAKTFG
jgi:hypothetical protein